VDDGVGFDEFVGAVRPRLARAFAAAYGIDRGQEALAEAMGYAWEHFEVVAAMENPAGYLYRVGQSRSRPRRRAAAFPAPAKLGLPDVEPRLGLALGGLSERQRVCVMLVHGFEWTHQEVADLLDVSRSTVQNHVERGLEHLRSVIGTSNDA
jgi:RNA polymerase sigma-70 factor (ECF subfamily)